jgi:hypothetical protein
VFDGEKVDAGFTDSVGLPETDAMLEGFETAGQATW